MKSGERIERVVEVIHDLEAQSDFNSLLLVLSEFAASLGLKYSSIGQVVNPALMDGPITDYGVSDFPEEWKERFLKENHVFHDPIIHYAVKARTRYSWAEAREHADPFGQRIYDRARDYGLNDGIAIPVRIPGKPMAVLSFASDGEEMSDIEASIFEVVCIHAYGRFTKIKEQKDSLDAPPSIATAREREILHYIASGKTSWETSQILGISEATVVKHLSNLSEKLGTQNRIHTVTVGIREGIILP